MGKRKFLFLYLNTGAGHLSAAKVLAEAMRAADPDIEVRMINGFGKNRISRFVFEKGYNFACNYAHGAFSLIYDIGQHRWFQTLCRRFVGPGNRRFLRKVIRDERPTDIVSFHFGISSFVRDVLAEIPRRIHFTVIVTDPFTVPHSWFYCPDVQYFVYSEQARDTAVRECGVPAENVRVVPFLMNGKFRVAADAEEIRRLRVKHGFDPDRKMVLLVGGGEGLPGATKIINECILHRAEFSISVICGRDAAKRKRLGLLRLTYPKLDLHVFGFIDFLDELVKICDCAVIKAGPATLMEVLSCRKPVIICKYIHNQELGNMRFAVEHRVGWFTQNPRRIYRKINEYLNDTEFDAVMKKNFDSVNIDTDASKVARLLLER